MAIPTVTYEQMREHGWTQEQLGQFYPQLEPIMGGGDPWVALATAGLGLAAGWIAGQVGNGGGAVQVGNGGIPHEAAAAMLPYGIAGPGVPEPANGTWSKRWSVVANSQRLNETWRVYFWQMLDGYTLMYNPMTRGWKRYKQKRAIVLSSDPRLSNIARAERAVFGKLRKLAKKSGFLALQKSAPRKR